jgi:UDP-N-acetylmuramate-alanine ligase
LMRKRQNGVVEGWIWSFVLHLHPNIACITSMDADHLDIYGTSEAIENLLLNLHLKLKTKAIFYNKRIAARRRNLFR